MYPFRAPQILFNLSQLTLRIYFIFARKSTESEDRQVLSIEAQIKELKALALNQVLNVVDVFSEAKSAKAPGHPILTS